MDQLIQQVKYITGGSTENEAQSPDECRNLILQVFVNIDKHKSVLGLVFEMLNLLLTNNPELFIVLDSDGIPDVKEEGQRCLKLTVGLVHNLLVLLSNPNNVGIESEAVTFVSRLLLLLKAKDPAVFKRVSSELIFCLSDLVAIETDIYSSGYPRNPEIRRFSSVCDQHSSVVLKQFHVDSLDTCGRLQVAITQILMSMAPELCLYTPNIVQQVTGSGPSALWSSLCYQLEYGGLQLKAVSLELLMKLLTSGGLPDPVILDYYLDCLVALVELACSGVALDQGDCVPLEVALSDNLSFLSSFCQPVRSLDHNTEQIRDELSLGVCQCIMDHGLEKLQTTELKRTICDLLRDTWNCLDGDRYRNSILFGQMKNAVGCLLQCIGHATNIDHVVHLIAASLQYEVQSAMRELFPKHNTNLNNQPGQENDFPRKVKASDVLHSSAIYKCLMTRLEDLLGMLKDVDTRPEVAVVEGIWLILEILAWTNIALCDGGLANRDRMEFDLPAEISSELIGLWRRLLLQLAQNDWDGAAAFCDYVVRGIGALLELTDLGQSDVSVQQFVVWTLSMPWLSSEVTWSDLKPLDNRKHAELLAAFGDRMHTRTQTACIRLLASMTKDVAPVWRAKVMQLALGSGETDVRCAAVRCLPVFIRQSGPAACHLVEQSIHPMLTDRDDGIQKALAVAAGTLACAMSGQSRLKKTPPRTRDDATCCCDAIEVHCAICQKTASPEVAQGHTDKDDPRDLDVGTFLPFVEAFLKRKSGVSRLAKVSLIRSIPLILGHVSLRGSNSKAATFVSLCLQPATDPDYDVRLELSTVAEHFIRPLASGQSAEALDSFVSALVSAVHRCRATDQAPVLDTVLLTVGRVAGASTGQLQLSMLVILVDYVCRKPSQSAWAVACGQLRRAAARACLVSQHGRTLLSVVADRLHDAGSGRLRHRQPADVLTDVATAFGFARPDDFLRRTESLLLPHVVRKATPTASTLLRLIGKQLGHASHRTALNANMRHIFCQLVCSCDGDELRRTLVFLEAEIGWRLGDILKAQSNINFELLLHLATDPQRVLVGLKILIARSDSCEHVSKAAVVESLRPCLLGILVHFDNFLNNRTVPARDRLKAYRSLVPLMRLMGTEHITRVRVRLMTTLRIGLSFDEPDAPAACCAAWSCFVHMLDLAAAGSMLSQIVVNLLPLIRTASDDAVPIVEYLIVENEPILKEHFSELYFLPDSADLRRINAILRPYTEDVYRSEGFTTHVHHLLRGVTHESLDVRQLALSKLKALLRANQSSVRRLVLGSETVDPMASLIVGRLLQGCRESDQSMRILYAECLGELGAIDPGRLGLTDSEPKRELADFSATIGDSDFAYGLVSELAKAFLRADNRRAQDCVAFAIQELIRIFGISRQPDDTSAGGALWRRFSDEVRQILTPLFESKYTMTMSCDWSRQARPIYDSKKCKTFDKWISTLTGYLAAKVRAERPLRVLDACRGVIGFVGQISLYLLPHVVVHVLLEGRPDERQELVDEILAVLHHANNPDTRRGSASDLRHMSTQTVFNILDHLTAWSRHRLALVSSQEASRKSSAARPEKPTSDPGYRCMTSFLARIPQDLLARASYNCGAVSRALMHFEQHLKEGAVQTQQNYDFLQQLYIALHEPDGVTGVTAVKQSSPTLGDQIKAYESLGRLSDASVCYDKAIQLEPDNLAYRQGLIRCRLALGELQSALALANGIIADRPAWSGELNPYRVEAAWKLGQWDELDLYLRPEQRSADWNVGLGRLLLAAKRRDQAEVRSQLRQLRCQQMAPLSAACMELGSYQRGYEYIVRLHILNEVEATTSTLFGFGDDVDPEQLVGQWHDRLQFTQDSYQTQEPILNVRRIMLSLAGQEHGPRVDEQIGRTWLQMAKVARECGLVQTAHSSLLSASAYDLPEYCLENASWLWERGEYDKAKACLEQALDRHYADRSQWAAPTDGAVGAADVDADRRLACAKILLLLGRYSEETASWESNAIMRQYREVQQVHGQWEEGYFYTGKYYDKIMVQLIETEKPERKGEFIVKIVRSFGQSLMYGSQYIYQSMPRMLTLWLDYGSEAVDAGKRTKNEVQLASMKSVVTALNRLMAGFSATLAPYQFLTAFPQLISRICHPDGDVFAELRDIIARILVEFRQQAMWMMMAVSKSSYQTRVRRCTDIFTRAQSMDGDLRRFLQDATKLTDRLLDLCNRNVDVGSHTLSVGQHFKPLQRLITDANFSPILIPLQAQMTPVLPSGSASPSNHCCFPGSEVHIAGIEDTIEVLPSLQRPKKVTFRGTDGRQHVMLCKPKDDLRKDGRLMEFNGIINKCLHKDPESRRRRLHIRTYAVTPLNEECGLLEWVPHTAGLRNIILRLYKERGLYTSGKELKALQLPPNAPLDQKRRIYLEQLLPRHPAIFSQWFLKTFPDPTSWYNARLAYARTVAVMSMVGYVLGLGDRHGENILFDATSGDCVHVDFNCLFNKGETFDYPELVPFRLTHNMIEAMGPTGHEGLFRRASEVTLRVMRLQMDPLMSVLSTFIYDPLVEWSKPAARGKAADTGETRNEKARTHIVNIESRLKGVLKNRTKSRGLPLSVEGQVSHLIKEATDVNNLCQMYIGWAAYM